MTDLEENFKAYLKENNLKSERIIDTWEIYFVFSYLDLFLNE
jgi:hypothetical protein